jgi:hypothetical protein
MKHEQKLEARLRLKALTNWNSPGLKKRKLQSIQGEDNRTHNKDGPGEPGTRPQEAPKSRGQHQIGPTTTTFICPTQSRLISNDLTRLTWLKEHNAPSGTGAYDKFNYAVLCDEPALFSDTGNWRLRNNRLADSATLSSLVSSADPGSNEEEKLSHAIIFNAPRNSTRRLDAYQGWNTNLNIIALRGEVGIRTSNGASLSLLATLRADDENNTNTWEKWTAENNKHPQGQTKSYTIIQPTTETAVWIELRSTKNMQRKGCNKENCNFNPCGFSNHEGEGS